MHAGRNDRFRLGMKVPLIEGFQNPVGHFHGHSTKVRDEVGTMRVAGKATFLTGHISTKSFNMIQKKKKKKTYLCIFWHSGAQMEVNIHNDNTS